MQPDVILGYASGIAGYDEVDGLSQLGLPVVPYRSSQNYIRWAWPNG